MAAGASAHILAAVASAVMSAARPPSVGTLSHELMPFLVAFNLLRHIGLLA
jgi:hypothetical protein